MSWRSTSSVWYRRTIIWISAKNNLEQRESQRPQRKSGQGPEGKVDALYVSQQAKLEEISQLSREQAKEMILSRVDEELTHEKAVHP